MDVVVVGAVGMNASLRDLLPREVAVSERQSSVGIESLLPEEVPHIRRSIPKRAVEFATGRRCARDALAELGLAGAHSVPIIVGASRQPTWPSDVRGSITHCDGRTAAAAAWADEISAIGIDIELNQTLSPDVVARICHPGELADLPSVPGLSWPTVLFSAREAVFKAWYPASGTWLDHHDVIIETHVPQRRFTVRFLGENGVRAERAGLDGLEGAFGWGTTHVYAAAWVRARDT